MSTFHESENTAPTGAKRFEHFVLGSQPIKDRYGNPKMPYGEITGTYRPRDRYISYGSGIDDYRTPTLFSHEPTGIYVHSMYFDPSLRIHAPTMVANLHRKYKAPIIPSDDLSKYSHQLVEHAKRLKLPVMDTPVDQHNSVGLFENTMDSVELDAFKEDPTISEIPASTMNYAKQHLRKLRGTTKQKEKIAPAENIPLPGMETF